MLVGLFIASLVSTIAQSAKNTFTPTITAEQWENKDLIHEDIMKGVSVKQQIKNAQSGKYIVTEKYPEPHRDSVSGKIIIENCQLWKGDLAKYGAYQTSKWAKQGKYNLSPEELKKEEERIKKHFEYLYKL